MKESKKLICVICGCEWKNKYTNRCENKECSGFCSWGYELNKPESFNVDDKGNWHLNPPPKNEKLEK